MLYFQQKFTIYYIDIQLIKIRKAILKRDSINKKYANRSQFPTEKMQNPWQYQPKGTSA